MFLSAHYAGEDMVLKLQPGEPWKKAFGPVFIYLNSLPDDATDHHSRLWDDAKIQVRRSTLPKKKYIYIYIYLKIALLLLY